jgi:hypothetical protein
MEKPGAYSTPGTPSGMGVYFVMIRLFVIYLSYLNIDNLLQIKFVKAALATILTKKSMFWKFVNSFKMMK